MSEKPVRIAMWSGPRTISTALLRSWGSRGDTSVCDEPLYAYYLHETGRDHPGAAQIMAHYPTDWRIVVDWLTGPIPGGRRIFYQKHMAHHLLSGIDRGWLEQVSNCFLIRDPGEMLPSLAKVLPQATLLDTGLPQQVEIFESTIERTGRVPPVIDSRDVLANPREVLSHLCERISVEFDDAMLHWEPGPRETDGNWAPYWYGNVLRSTGFEPYERKSDPMDNCPDGPLAGLMGQCRELYSRMYEHRIA